MADTLARAVSEIAAEAGRLALARYGTDVQKWEKSPDNFVCEVDLAVDELLRTRLSALLPEAGWLSEETADDLSRLSAPRVWVVDPIDGTRDYLRKRPGWAVSIALVEKGQPIIGVLDAPVREEHWIAATGLGATRNGVPIAASDRTVLSGARVPADDLPKVDRDLSMVDKPNSIALRMAMVAAGDADLLATFRWGNDWDIAASTLIAREAGATITDALGKKLRFNTPRGESFGVLVTAPGIHQAAAERLRPRAVTALGKP
ncbi:3'(2'),5'-bisphosphate nucleotidase CysQ [Sphingomonas sp. LT1P40]|uniref:3'(2'),5'-bisphosphate nucleotidase CysQ n=1 Tax=Alteristakelama amylovorans TaxID=3096166 RepID=UPI002FCBC55C